MRLDKTRFGLLAIVVGSSLAIGYGMGVTSEKHDLKYAFQTPGGEIHNFDPYREVNYAGSMKVGEYVIHFQKAEQNENLKGQTTGYTYPGGKKEIWIKTGRSAEEIEATCDHEVFHEEFSKFRHPEGDAKFSDPIYKYSDDARIVECDIAVEVALASQ